MANTPEDLVNQALFQIGFPERIASLFEGSRAATAALEVWGQTRDELLDAGDWPLARRANLALTLWKGPPPAGGYTPLRPWTPADPPPGWLYAYLYPADMLTLKAVLRPPQAMFELDPRPAVWRVDNDNSLIDRNGAPAKPQKVILANIKGALATYTGQVTDPALWEPGFNRVLVENLAKKLGQALRDSLPLAKQEEAELAHDLPAAESERG